MLTLTDNHAPSTPQPRQRDGAVKARNELTPTEAARRAELEAIIRPGITDCIKVGAALRAMSDERLYRNTHSTFREYVEDVYRISVRTAYELVEHADVVKSLPPECANFAQTATPSQTRELAKVEPEKRAQVIKVVTSKGPVTAMAIREAANPEPEDRPQVVAHVEVMKKGARFVPSPGNMLELRATIRRIPLFAIIAHATQPGFCHVTVSSGDSDSGDCRAGLLEFTTKPIRADFVEHLLEYVFHAPATEWLTQIEATEYQGEPWTFNELAYHSYQDYIDRVVLGKGRTGA